MTTNPFSIKQLQVLELTQEHNPKVDVKNDKLIITACINDVETIITVPVDATLSNHAKKPVISKPVSQPKRHYSFSTSIGKSRQGVLNGMAKLTEDDVREIRQLLTDESYANKFESRARLYADIASAYNVSGSCIMLIDTKRTWKHVSV
jgi:hypothetical protein